jgi:hypothetical protein
MVKQAMFISVGTRLVFIAICLREKSVSAYE